MIVDTSALVAIAGKEAGFEALSDAIIAEGGLVPAPALVEYHRVVTRRGKQENPHAVIALKALFDFGLDREPFTAQDADAAIAANRTFGQGNGRGGTLNMLDLMVYAVARRLQKPILCTGGDFAATDVLIHPSSRTL